MDLYLHLDKRAFFPAAAGSTPALNKASAFQSAQLFRAGWETAAGREGARHRVMNEPVRLVTLWSCLLTPSLISLIKSRALMRVQTYASTLEAAALLSYQ